MSVDNNKEGPLTPLVDIWMCPFIENEVLVDEKRVCRCLHPGCIKEGEKFNGKNATKALGRLLGLKGCSITACTGNISRAKLDQYRQLYERKSFSNIDSKGRGSNLLPKLMTDKLRLQPTLWLQNQSTPTQTSFPLLLVGRTLTLMPLLPW